jgi:Kdo2-lipid IVA lauroyltransferase/acyltransferase
MESVLSLRSDMSRFLQSSLNVSLAKFMPRKVYRRYFVLLGLVYLALRRDIRTKISSGTRSVYGNGIGIVRQLRLKRDIYLGLVDHYFEKMWNIYSPFEAFRDYIKRHTVVANKAWLDHSLQNHGGILLISGHYGGVEYLAITLSVLGYQPAIIARFKTPDLLQKTLLKAKSNNIKILNADESKVFFRAARVLKEGRILITMCDEFSRWICCHNKTVTVFGKSLFRDKTLELLHRRVNVPVCLGLMQRGKKGYQLEIQPLSALAEASGESIANLSWRSLEHFILQNPGQWYQWQKVTETLKNYQKEENNLH